MNYYIVKLCNYVSRFMFKSNAIVSTSFYKLPIRDKCVRV